eukprot:GAHX01000139.1.p1 GENE.GAHX01000139.1~~GAHX01000139.1.p1  ORF type:complete len:356 (-),score=69.93 GAHX01000139.1:215-1237(-)
MPRGRPKAQEATVENANESELNYSDHAPEDDLLNEEAGNENNDQEVQVSAEPNVEVDSAYEQQGGQQSYNSAHGERQQSYPRSYGESTREDRDNQGFYRQPAPENSVIAIFNLNDDTTEQDIRTLTEPFGEVEHVNMIYNHNTDVFRGFCFVRFASLESARDARQSLEDKTVKGNQIRVDFCKDKERRPMRGGFRRDRGGYGGDSYHGKPKRHEYRGYDDRQDNRRDGGYGGGYERGDRYGRNDRYERGGRRDDSYGRRERRYDDRDDRRQRHDRGSYDRDDRGNRGYNRESRDYRENQNDGYGNKGGRNEDRYNNDRDNRPRNGYESMYGQGENRDRRY